jgi:hypothetical protein
VRHRHLPEREIVTGIGPVAVRCARVRDRVGKGSERIRFSSAILPRFKDFWRDYCGEGWGSLPLIALPITVFTPSPAA